MAKIIKNLTITWTWNGDSYSLRGFNIVVTPSTGNPTTNAIVSATVGNVRSYVFNNIMLDDGINYVSWVQAVYDGKDSNWINTGNVTASDDGNATVTTTSTMSSYVGLQINNLMASSQTSISQTKDSILASVDTSLASLDANITQRYTNQIKATSDSFNINLTQLQSLINNNNANISQINTYFSFSANGLEIGKSGSPFKVSISNSEMDFKDGETIVAYITGQKMNIPKLDVNDSLEVGNHKIEKYSSTMTIITFIG